MSQNLAVAILEVRNNSLFTSTPIYHVGVMNADDLDLCSNQDAHNREKIIYRTFNKNKFYKFPDAMKIARELSLKTEYGVGVITGFADRTWNILEKAALEQIKNEKEQPWLKELLS